MARVVLVGNLAQVTGGVAEFSLSVTSVQQLFRQLSALYPALERHLESGVAVAIDGQIFQDSLLEPIGPDSEVFVLPQIAGGTRGQVLHSDIFAGVAGVHARKNVGM
jgi:molybdopterin converting factor small subunit